jgi:hypothetical protein
MLRGLKLATLMIGIASGCSKPAPAPAKADPAAPPAPPGSTVVIADAGATFGGQQVPMPATTAQLTAVLGQPDRTLEKANRVLVWDQRGIYAYCRKSEDQIHDISFAFQKQDYDFEPNSQFNGTLDVAGTKINAQTQESELTAAGFKQEGPSLEKNLGTSVVIVDFDGRVLSVSFSTP